jgi:hypothetical protein
MAAWVADSNNAIQQAYTSAGGQGSAQPGAGTPQETLAAQEQFARLYGFNPQLNAQGQVTNWSTAGGYTGLANQAPGQTLAANEQAYRQQLDAINAAASLQANPFRQQQVIGQLGRILGGQPAASFSAPNTVAGVGTAGGTGPNTGMAYMQQLIDDIRNPGANQASVNSVLEGIPTPNKINSQDFLRAAPSTQSMILQGMQEKYGLDPKDSLAQIKNTMPQFASPTTFGTVKG